MTSDKLPSRDQSVERLYIPSDYADEICPEGRASPDAWIGPAAGDVWHLVPCEEGHEPDVRLLPGEIVEFTWVEDLGSVEVELHADDTHTTHGDVPAEATHFWVRFDQDTLADSLDECMRQWRENVGDDDPDERIEVCMARWADPDERYRFEVGTDGTRFVPVPSEALS